MAGSYEKIEEHGSNKRRFDRFSLKNDLIVTLNTGRALKGESLNLSEGGMLVGSPGAGVKEGDRIFIELMGRFRYNLGFLIGEVVYWSDKVEDDHDEVYGIKFTSLTHLQKDTLKEVISNICGVIV